MKEEFVALRTKGNKKIILVGVCFTQAPSLKRKVPISSSFSLYFIRLPSLYHYSLLNVV